MRVVEEYRILGVEVVVVESPVAVLFVAVVVVPALRGSRRDTEAGRRDCGLGASGGIVRVGEKKRESEKIHKQERKD